MTDRLKGRGRGRRGGEGEGGEGDRYCIFIHKGGKRREEGENNSEKE